MRTLVIVVVVVAILAVLVWVFMKLTGGDLTPEMAASILDEIARGEEGPYDIDDFTSIVHKNPIVEEARQRVIEIEVDYPADEPGKWCSDEGLREIAALAEELRRKDNPDGTVGSDGGP